MKKRAKKMLRGVAVALAVIVGLAGAGVAAIAIAESYTEQFAHISPDYERIDLTPLLVKEEWTDEDYRTLYLQTGLGREPLDEMKNRPSRILEFQENLFREHTWHHSQPYWTTKHEITTGFTALIIDLKPGDILVTSTCHTLGWRNGHAAIAVGKSTLLESIGPGSNSDTCSLSWFRASANFIVLRPKNISEEERAEIADWARTNLYDIPYSLFPGFFFPKDEGDNIHHTHCSHLVWQAYQHFGYDIDCDGGPLVSTKDIANSPLLEPVQVFGFDLDLLWNY